MYVCMYVCNCIYVCMHICMYVCMYVIVYMYACNCIYVCNCMYVCIMYLSIMQILYISSQYFPDCGTHGYCDFKKRFVRAPPLPPVTRCVCEPGWTGQRCGECCNLPCHHGTCQIVEQNKQCICNKGFEGQYCNVSDSQEPPSIPLCPINRCTLIIPGTGGWCQNGGTCSLSTGCEPVCKCVPPYCGPRCLHRLTTQDGVCLYTPPTITSLPSTTDETCAAPPIGNNTFQRPSKKLCNYGTIYFIYLNLIYGMNN